MDMRDYDPAIARWLGIDPLATMSNRFSPYTYAVNNPVYFIDPNGIGIPRKKWTNFYNP